MKTLAWLVIAAAVMFAGPATIALFYLLFRDDQEKREEHLEAPRKGISEAPPEFRKAA